ALSIPMFLTALWLLWVLSSVSPLNNIVIALGLIIITIIIFAIIQKLKPQAWLYQSRVFILFFVIIGAMALIRIPQIIQEAKVQDEYIVWSNEKVEEELNSGKIVFVNFTADWCITCKVNERAVFKNPKVIAAFKENNVSYLVADWTKKDEKIARALSSHGRVGVPMYLIYDESGKSPKVLPQILTPKIVINALGE
ncbi:MAG: thioredoxin family protein, partial [Caulobacterales bacterium]|nr:thioredoxin family protein [Caulobacterales bacterium]